MVAENGRRRMPQIVWSGAFALVLALVAMVALAGPAAAQQDSGAEEAGILIVSVTADGPSAQAGLARGDILLEVNGEAIESVDALLALLEEAAPGDVWTLTVLHGDDERSLEVTLGEREGRAYLGLRPFVDLASSAVRTVEIRRHGPPMGLHVSPHMGPHMGFAVVGVAPERVTETITSTLTAVKGAVVVEVVADGPAAAAGIEPGDIIVSIDGEPVGSQDSVAERIGALAPGTEVTLEVRRGGPEGEIEEVPVTLGSRSDDETQGYLGVRMLSVQAGSVAVDGGHHAWAVPAVPGMPLMMPHFGPYAAPPIFYAPYGYGWGMPYMMPYAMPMPGVEVEAPSVFFRAEPLEQDMGEAEGQDGARVEGVRVFRFHALPFHAAPFHAAPYHAIPFHIAPFQGTPEVMFGIAPGMRELEEGEDVQLHRIPDAGMWMPATPAEDFELAEALEL